MSRLAVILMQALGMTRLAAMVSLLAATALSLPSLAQQGGQPAPSRVEARRAEPHRLMRADLEAWLSTATFPMRSSAAMSLVRWWS